MRGGPVITALPGRGEPGAGVAARVGRSLGWPAPPRHLPHRLRGRADGLWALTLTAVFAGVVLAAFLASALSTFSMEDGIVAVGSRSILDGRLPYRDFGYLWGPLGFVVPTLSTLIFHSAHLTLKVTGLVYTGFLLSMVTAIGYRHSRGCAAASLFLGALTVSASPLPIVLALGALGALALLVAGLRRAVPRPRLETALGVTAAATAMTRLDFAPWCAILVVLAVAITRRRRPAVAFAMVVAGIIAATIARCGVGPTVQNLVIEPLRIGGDRQVPFRMGTLSIGLAMLLVAAPILHCAAAWVSRRSEASRNLHLALAICAIAVLPEVAQRADVEHLQTAAFLTLPALACAVAVLLGTVSSLVVRRQVVLALLLVLVVSGLGWRSSAGINRALDGHTRYVVVGAGDRRLVFDSPIVARDRQRATDIVLARPGARVLVAPINARRTSYAETALYALFPAEQVGGYFLDMYPGVGLRRTGRWIADLRQADVILLGASSFVEPSNRSRLLAPASIDEVLLGRQCAREEMPTMTVLYDCAFRPSG